ncbi:MAG: tyrosine-type recombinase/integrase, partial [Eubacteriales bacterium]|nr:tyrosine-type recombinase/integrase [Eubacteriales bacterium]
NGRLCVRRSVTQNCEITQGKTRAAQRTMVITDHAQKILDDQAAMLRAAGIVSPWLFPGSDGSMSDPRLMYKRWEVYRRQHNITVSLHELRHTHISLMQDAVPANALKRMVGHTKNMDTFGVYGHEVDGDAEKAAQIIDGVFDNLI